MIYWQIIRFSFLRFFSYPFEILAAAAKRLVEVLFLIFFWSLVIKNSTVPISLPQISSYFLIGMGVGDLVMSRWGPLGSDIGRLVKSGQFSNYLIRPTGLIPTLYSLTLGRNGLRMMLAVINIIAGLIVYPPQSIISIILFFLFLITAWLISFAYNLLQGIFFLHFTDAYGIRNAVENFIRIFTGALVPIYLFPTRLRQIVRLTPFPGMNYGPTNALHTSVITSDVVFDLGVTIFWALVLNVIIKFLWRYSMKKYEAVGI